jgi:hypothetical protein
MKQNKLHIIISLSFLILSCTQPKKDNEKFALKSNINIEPQTDKIEQITTTCLDTIELSNRKIKYSKYHNFNKWVLSWQKSVDQGKISSLVYFYSAKLKSDNCIKPIDYFSLDSIQIEFTEREIQTIEIEKFSSFSTFENLSKPNSKLLDINFDGLIDFDLGLNEISGATNEMRRYYVYNPIKNEFEKGLDIANLGIDSTNRLLYNSWSGGHAGKISTRIWSDIINYDSLRTIKEINSDYHKEIDSYVIRTSQLNKEKEYSVSIDTVKRE